MQSSLSQIILVKNFPRSLIQIVLQVEDSPENDYVNTKIVQASLVSEGEPFPRQTGFVVTNWCDRTLPSCRL